MTFTNESTDTGRLNSSGVGIDNEPGLHDGTTSEVSTPLQRTTGHLFEDSTPTPSRVASPQRPSSALATRASDSEVLPRERAPLGRAKRRGRAGTGPRRGECLWDLD